MLFIFQSTLWRQITWKKSNSLIHEYAICNEISRFLISLSFFRFKNLQKCQRTIQNRLIFRENQTFCLIALDKIWKTHSTVGRWKKRAIFRQAPRRQVQRAPLSATSYRRCAQLSDATVSKQLLWHKKVFDKNCRESCESQILPEKFCDSTKIKNDIGSKKIFNLLLIFIIDF